MAAHALDRIGTNILIFCTLACGTAIGLRNTLSVAGLLSGGTVVLTLAVAAVTRGGVAVIALFAGVKNAVTAYSRHTSAATLRLAQRIIRRAGDTIFTGIF